MSDITTPGIGSKEPISGFEPCPDPWAKLHIFYNPETHQVIPARCKRWTCFQCAQVNYYKVDHLISLGNPERFITLTRAGRTPKEIRINLQKLIQGLRRQGYVFEYAAVVELHLNGTAHLHLMQRGDFIPQELLSEMWQTYTASSFPGGSFIVDIRRIDPNQNVKGYLLKYLRKSWEADDHSPKSWHYMQSLFPGLNHYRMSKNWLPERPEKSQGWQIVPKSLLDVVGTEIDAVEELFYTGNQAPLSPALALGTMYSEKARVKAKMSRKKAKLEADHQEHSTGPNRSNPK